MEVGKFSIKMDYSPGMTKSHTSINQFYIRYQKQKLTSTKLDWSIQINFVKTTND